jgi:hypothetical protein
MLQDFLCTKLQKSDEVLNQLEMARKKTPTSNCFDMSCQQVEVMKLVSFFHGFFVAMV